MAHVIGCHTIKGNSQVSHGVAIAQGVTLKEGEAVQIVNANPLTVGKLAAGGVFAGYVSNIYKDANTANLAVASAGLALPAGAGWQIGDVASISLTTGMIGTGAVGERKTNGTVIELAKVVDAKTGIESDGVVVRFGMAEDRGAV